MHLAARARRIASLDHDPDEASELLARDRIVAPLLRARPGLRAPGTWDPFETGVRAIVGRQVTVAAASTISGRLVRRHGTPVGGLHELGLTHTFPAADTLAEADLDGLGLTGARRDAIRAFARAVVGDDVRLDGSVSLEQLVEPLSAIDGLGEWTAHYVALRLGERDAFPANDLGLRRALGALPGGSEADIERIAERWRPWRALSATHLWSAPRPDVARIPRRGAA